MRRLDPHLACIEQPTNGRDHEKLAGAPSRTAACDITVAICTRDRSEVLRAMLERLVSLRLPDGTTWEVLVVDNGSTDATREIINSFEGRLPIRYVFEGV